MEFLVLYTEKAQTVTLCDNQQLFAFCILRNVELIILYC